MPKGGTILITASARQTRDPTLPNTSERPYICLSIRDDGSGIEADQQARVFEPFFTTKPIGRGSGLGLSQVFGFTAQSGGFTELQSELGKGTRVSLCFPHQSIEMPIDVLFVEDEDDLRSVVVEALTSQGFQVTPASNGDEALVLLRGDAVFAVVVTDFNMPDSADGLEVAAEAAVAQPQARVMLASGLQRSQLPRCPRRFDFSRSLTASDSLLRRSTKTWAARRGGFLARPGGRHWFIFLPVRVCSLGTAAGRSPLRSTLLHPPHLETGPVAHCDLAQLFNFHRQPAHRPIRQAAIHDRPALQLDQVVMARSTEHP